MLEGRLAQAMGPFATCPENAAFLEAMRSAAVPLSLSEGEARTLNLKLTLPPPQQ